MKTLAMAFATVVLLSGMTMVTPTTLSAQECTTKCGCISDGCGCSSSGGNGGECSSSGDGCFVKKCGTELQSVSASALLTPEGQLVTVDDLFATGAETAGLVPVAALAENTRWERMSEGHWVLRNCAGMVLRQAFDTPRSERIRSEATELAI